LKTCRQCKESKPLDEFNRRAESKDGRAPRCRLCTTARRRQIYREGPGQTLPDLTTDQKKHVYTAVILRMREQGLASSETTNEMLARVGDL
jgi:hypothetical protein